MELRIIKIQLFYFFIFSILCYSQEYFDPNPDISPFIETQKLNPNCLLVKLGSDAVTAINIKNGIIVIDAGISTGLTQKYKSVIENEFHKDNFLYVINTHGHYDHTGGNSVFNSTVIAHKNCQKDMSSKNRSRQKKVSALYRMVEEYQQKSEVYLPYSKDWIEMVTQKARYLNAYNDAVNPVQIKAPGITFSDSMTIDLPGLRIELLYFGNCHSCSDILVYIPEMKILFTGDLVCKYGRPSVSGKYDKGDYRWIKAVKWIEERMNKIEHIVCGHGDILYTEDLIAFNSRIMTLLSQKDYAEK